MIIRTVCKVFRCKSIVKTPERHNSADPIRPEFCYLTEGMDILFFDAAFTVQQNDPPSPFTNNKKTPGTPREAKR